MFHASKISTFMGNLHKVRKIASKASLLLLTGKKEIIQRPRGCLF